MSVVQLDPMQEPIKPRVCKEGVLEEYLQFCNYQESPMDFHMWTCISIVCMAMGRNCYIDWGAWKIYPNMYVILVGESALTHKSTAIGMGVKQLNQSLPQLNGLGQVMSPQAICSYLAHLSEKEGEATAYMDISELSVLLGRQKVDDSLLKLLTDLWDCPTQHKSFTIGRGQEVMHNVCLNMLAGSTESWLRNSIPVESLEGGFFSRLILVNRKPTGMKIARPMMRKKHMDAVANVRHDLREIGKLKGAFTITPDGERTYDNWYLNHNHPEKAESFMRGYFGRKGDFVLKISMAISAMMGDTMHINSEHINFALTILEENEEKTRHIVRYMGTTEDGGKNIAVLHKIKNSVINVEEGKGKDAKMVTRVGIEHSKLLRTLSHKYRAAEIGDILDGLDQAGEIQRIYQGKRTVYKYIGGGLEEQEAAYNVGE